MSLINQVLKDLDQQRGPVAGNHIAALQGIGLVNNATSLWPRIAIAFGILVGVALLSVYAYQSLGTGSMPGIEYGESVQAAPEPALRPDPLPAEGSLEQPAPTDKSTQAEELSADTHAASDSLADPEITAPDSQADKAETIEQPVAPTATQTPETVYVENVTIKRMSPRQQAEQQFVAAQRAIGRNDMARAKGLLDLALIAYPGHADARLELAGIYLAQQREQAAEEVLKTGLALNPRYGPLWRLYAQLLAGRGEFDAALQVLGQASLDGLDGAETLGLRAAILSRLERFELASADYRSALERVPERADWWAGYAIVLEHRGRSDVAVEAYRRALRLPLQESLKVFAEQRLRLLKQHTNPKDG